MTDETHTPGPWQLEPNGACWDLYAPAVRSERHCILIGMTWLGVGEHSANARLCASAPELLEALEAMLADGQKLFDIATWPQSFQQARATITKAKEILK